MLNDLIKITGHKKRIQLLLISQLKMLIWKNVRFIYQKYYILYKQLYIYIYKVNQIYQLIIWNKNFI